MNGRLLVKSDLIELKKVVDNFDDYIQRISSKDIIIKKKDGTCVPISRKANSRYFPEGRKVIRGRIYKRLGKFQSEAVMVTLEYDPHRINKIEAWSKFSIDSTRFLASINRYIRRKSYFRGQKYKNLGYIRSVEEMPYYRKKDGKILLDGNNEPVLNKSGGYPHIHIVFPGINWLASLDELKSLWKIGNITVKAYDNMNIVGYLVSYISKMKDWSKINMAIIWELRKRLYSISKRYMLPMYKKEFRNYLQDKGSISSKRFMKNLRNMELLTRVEYRIYLN